MYKNNNENKLTIGINSSKYPNRFDVYNSVTLTTKMEQIPLLLGIVNGYFSCSEIGLTTLYNCPIEVHDFYCHKNNLTTLDHLPKYIDGGLECWNNPFQNLNGLKDVEIKRYIWISNKKESTLDYWIKALYNTDLDALEWHYDNHKYYFMHNIKLEMYVMNELEEIIKIKRLKKDLNYV